VPQAQGRPAVLDMADQGESASEQHYDPAKDSKRKAKSKDPAWKYCYWPDLNKKDIVKYCYHPSNEVKHALSSYINTILSI
jgi:hypothetical protein